MAELDFSALRAIAAPKADQPLIDQGFTIVDNADNPFLQASTTAPEPLFRAAFEYYKRHSPPMVDRAYWQSHTAGAEDLPPVELEYWDQAAKDMIATASAHGHNQLLTDLLTSIYGALEREYMRLRDSPIT